MSEDNRIAALEARVAALEAILGAVRVAFTGEAAAEGLSDDELDGSKYNDPVLGRDVPAKYWAGPSFKGRRLSQCSPEFLEAFAKYKGICARMNRKDAEKDPSKSAKLKYAEYDERDRQRALGWRRRLLAGWVAPAAPSEPENPFNAEEDDSWRDAPNPFASASDGHRNGASDSFDFGDNVEDGPL